MDRLYHYCSTQTFVSVINGKSIWLSSLSLSNDTLEGKLVNRVVSRLAERDRLDAATIKRLTDSIVLLEDFIDGLGFCLSQEGDLLSQWRGYAADATGVSIGFDRSYLRDLAEVSRSEEKVGFSLNQVHYLPSEHEARVEPTYRELRKHIDAGALRLPTIGGLLQIRTSEEDEEERRQIEAAQKAFNWKVLELFPELYHLKNYAFREEQEWRLVSFVLPKSAKQCLYRAGADRVIPYRSFKLDLPNRAPIAEVVLGPKHLTPINVVESMLEEAGFGKVLVRRSEASYR